MDNQSFHSNEGSRDLIQRSFTIACFTEDDMIEDGLMEIEETNSADEGIPLDDNEDDPIARDESELNEIDQEEEKEIELTKVTVPILA